MLAQKMLTMFCVLLLASGVAAPGSHAALTRTTAGLWYVAADGNDGNSCGDPGAPCASINAALAKPGFSPGDTVLVAAGTYTGAGDQVVLLDKSLTLSGGWNDTFTTQAGVSTIDGQAVRRGVTVLDGVTATIIAFSVQGGNALEVEGGGIVNNGSLTLTNSAVIDCHANEGGGVMNWGSLVLSNSAVTGNVAWRGGGIENAGSLALENSTVSGNRASWGGGVLVSWTSTTRLHNATISGNLAASGGGVDVTDSRSSVSMRNTLVGGNSATEGPDCAGTVKSAGYNLLGDGAGCSFVPVTGDRVGVPAGVVLPSAAPGVPKVAPLLSGSPAIDSGDPTGCKGLDDNILVTDQRGVARSGQCDIGAYEYTTPGPPATVYPFAGTPQRKSPGQPLKTLEVQVLDGIGSPVPGVLVTYVAPAAGPSGTFAGTGAYTSAARTAETGIAEAPVFTANAITGSYTVTATVAGLTPAALFSLANDTWTWYATADGNNGNACTSPQAPCATVNGVLAKPDFAPGETIRVSGSYYDENAHPMYWCGGRDSPMIHLDKDAAVSGGWNRAFGAQEGRSSIDGEWTFELPEWTDSGACTCVAVAPGVTAAVEGFSFRSCWASNRGTLTINRSELTDLRNHGVAIVNDSGVAMGWDTSDESPEFLNQGTLSLHGVSVDLGSSSMINQGMLTASQISVTGTTEYDWLSCQLRNLDGGVATVSDSTFSAECAIDNRSHLTLLRSAVTVGGVANTGMITVTASFIGGNAGAGLTNSGTLTVNSSTVAGNSGTGIKSTGTLAVNSSTVAGNQGSGIEAGGQAIVRNSILAGNAAADCTGSLSSGGYNLVGNMAGCAFTAGPGDLVGVAPGIGPLMGPPGAPKYYPLLPGSPAIDASNPAGCTDGVDNLLAVDQRGAARLGRCDIGAYEYTPPGPPASIQVFGGSPQHAVPLATFAQPLRALVLDAAGSPVPGVTVTFAAPASGPSGTFADSGAATTAAPTDADGIATAAPFAANALIGDYEVVATAGGLAASVSYALTNALWWFVAPSGNNDKDCQDPVHACATIGGALAKPRFRPGDTIRVAAGSYPDIVEVNKSAILLGGWDPEFTAQTGISILDGQGRSGGIMVRSNVTAIIERFEVRDCGVPYFDDAALNVAGGLTLVNSRVIDNRLTGIKNSGTLTLTNSSVSGNTGDVDGGGIRNQGTLTMSASSVTGNRARGKGGGIYNSGGALILENSTVSGNTSGSAGGGIYLDNNGTVKLSSSTVAGNSADGAGGGVDNASGAVTLRDSILAGNMAGEATDCAGAIASEGYNLIGTTTGCTATLSAGDLAEVDPQLGPPVGAPGASKYQPLLPGSPAIDAGDPAGCRNSAGDVLTADQRGVPRAGRCDIGAYEVTPPGPPAVIYASVGTPQHTPPGTVFSQPLQAAVLDAAGSPTPGVAVAFTAPTSGASGVFADTGTPATSAETGADGIATAAAFTANGTRGAFSVTAGAPGLDLPDVFFELGNLDAWYVAPGGDDRAACVVPELPCATITGALRQPLFRAGDEIRMATGTYDPDAGYQGTVLDRDVTLTGGWDAGFVAQTGTSVVDGEGQQGEGGITVWKTAVARIDHVTVQNTYYGISNEGTLTLRQSTVSDTEGGIHNYHQITVENSVIADNTGKYGAGISNRNGGTMILRRTSVLNNKGDSVEPPHGNFPPSDAPGGVYNSGDLTIEDCVVTGNVGGDAGEGVDFTGGILNFGTLMLRRSAVLGNTAGSGYYVACASGILNLSSLTVEDSVIAGNMGGHTAAGIGNSGTMTITGSLIADNRDSGTGGINNMGNATVRNSAVVGNTGAWRNGGIANGTGRLELSNSTVSGNTSNGGSGGIGNAGGAVTLASSTVSGNTALGETLSGGIGNQSGTVTLRNSIVAGNRAGSSLDCAGAIASGGYNLIQSAAGCTFTPAAGDLTGVDPRLGPLTGTPGYQPLLWGSPAINAGNPAGCTDAADNPLLTDQRGAPRVGRCDIGAYEAGLDAAKEVIRRGDVLSYTISLANRGGGVDLEPVFLTDTLPSGVTYVPASLTASNGSAVVEAGTLTWHGAVFSDTRTLIAFAAAFSDGLAPGTWITNTAVSSWAGFSTTAQAGSQLHEPARQCTWLPLILR